MDVQLSPKRRCMLLQGWHRSGGAKVVLGACLACRSPSCSQSVCAAKHAVAQTRKRTTGSVRARSRASHCFQRFQPVSSSDTSTRRRLFSQEQCSRTNICKGCISPATTRKRPEYTRPEVGVKHQLAGLRRAVTVTPRETHAL